jgi:hypothetical protein
MNEVVPLTDEGAKASEQEEIMRSTEIARIQAKVQPIPKSDFCLQCGANTVNGARWCDHECRDSW